jgi:prepilin signal peptidase PulO-like enzyme (type II secretory pathway)
MTYFLVILVGLVFGSFVNVLISRLKIEKNGSNQIDLKGGSYCDSCKRGLAWYEMIPVISYIFLKGKCVSCKERIPFSVPLVELAFGLLAVALYYSFGVSVEAIFLFLIGILMVAVFVYDLNHQLIPNLYIWIMVGLAIIYNLYLLIAGLVEIVDLFWGVVAGSGFFYLLYLLSKGRWIGLGDAKLMLVIGLVLAWPLVLVQLYISFIIGGVIGSLLMFFAGKKMKSKIAFGPFLVIAFFATVFYGDYLLNLVKSYLYL